MGQNWPKVMLTTSRSPADSSRIFCKAMNKILPNSFIFQRGNANQERIRIIAMDNKADYVYMVMTKEQQVHRLQILRVFEDTLRPEGPELIISQYIDHRIFGFDQFPETGPISTDLITRTHKKSLMDYFHQYWFLDYGKKNPLWLSIDDRKDRRTTYVAIIDAMTQRKLFFAEVELKSSA